MASLRPSISTLTRAGAVQRLATACVLLAGAASLAHAGSRDPGDATRRATTLLAQGDTTAAIDLLERSHLDDHTDPRAALLLGRVWRARGTIDGRLRSQRVLEAARLRFPGSVDVCMELGTTYFAQRFFPDAVACFERAVDLDPARCQARFMIGLYHYRNWKRMNNYRDDLVAAKRDLRAAAACDEKHAEASLLYLYACYALGEATAGEAERLLARFPARFEFHMLRGVLAYEAGDYDDCAAHFAIGMGMVDEQTRAEYQDLDSVLPAEALDGYDAAAPSLRATLRRGHWLAADPDPTTVVNERELEHLYRVFLANVLYSDDWGGQHGCQTDRGEVFVKFGRPLSVDYSLGDDARTGHVEVWSYVIGGAFYQFLFVDEFLNGKPRIPYSSDDLVHFIHHAPDMTALRPRVAVVPGEIDATVFRDDELNGSLYVAMRVDADTLDARSNPGLTNRYVLRGATFDRDWNRAGSQVDTVWTGDVARRVVSGSHVIEFVRRVAVPFDDYHVAWSLEDEHEKARASARADAEAARFAGDRLAVSDVLLFDEATGADAGHDGPSTVVDRGDRRMRPRIGHRYGPEETLRAYLEIYSLAVQDGASEYEVRYTIYPAADARTPVWKEWIRRAADVLGLSDSEPAIAQSFVRRGTDHTEREHIAIDIDSLTPGRYELVVEVTDLASGERAVAHTSLSREASRVTVRR